MVISSQNNTNSNALTGFIPARALLFVDKLIFLIIWGLGRSPKRGEGGSPTFSPFPWGRGLGLGMVNKHFLKTDFFYK